MLEKVYKACELIKLCLIRSTRPCELVLSEKSLCELVKFSNENVLGSNLIKTVDLPPCDFCLVLGPNWIKMLALLAFLSVLGLKLDTNHVSV